MIERMIRRIEGLRDELSVAALTTPTDKTEYGYGHAVGVAQGLQLALQVLQGELEHEKRGD